MPSSKGLRIWPQYTQSSACAAGTPNFTVFYQVLFYSFVAHPTTIKRIMHAKMMICSVYLCHRGLCGCESSRKVTKIIIWCCELSADGRWKGGGDGIWKHRCRIVSLHKPTTPIVCNDPPTYAKSQKNDTLEFFHCWSLVSCKGCMLSDTCQTHPRPVLPTH